MINTVAIASGAIGFFILGYVLYGAFLERRLVGAQKGEATPAHQLRDGVDYEPAHPLVLFGHHFASIAGAGPIIGPVLGVALFGWMAVLGWITLGTLFVGAVHDYLALMMSCRKQGRSVADISRQMISPRAGSLFSIFLWLALVLVIAVFGVVGSKALMAKEIGPQMVFPTFFIIPLAMLFGWIQRRGWMPLWLNTLWALAALLASIYVGYKWLPLSLEPLFPHNPAAQQNAWLVLLLIFYCAIASIWPVWLLLQPRDYLSMYALFLGLLLGYAGLFVAHPPMQAPLGQLVSKEGPLWPMLFVIVACGAISGFHAVVASGTSVKQLACETHGRSIGFGGMILEGILAVMALCLVGGGLYWSQGFAENPLYAPEILKKDGPLVVFAKGFGHVVGGQAFPWLSVGFVSLAALTLLKFFVLTTLDTCTRLARFVFTEQFGSLWAPFRQRVWATLITLLPAFVLAITGAWERIWPIFGAANQLIAALTLLVVTCYLLGLRKPSLYTALPGVFMLLTTIAALILQVRTCLTHRNEQGLPAPQWLLAAFALVLIVLALWVAAEALRRLKQLWTQRGESSPCAAVADSAPGAPLPSPAGEGDEARLQ